MQTNIATRARITTIELVPANSATDLLWTFPDQPYLRDKKILGIYLSANNNAPVSGKGNFYYALTINNSHSLFLTLVDNVNNRFVDSMPLKLFSAQQNIDLAGGDFNGANINGILAIDNKLIQWNKCFIRVAAATALANQSIVLNVIYQ